MGKYFGYFERNLDDRGRLQIPSKLIKDLPEVFYLIKGFDGCVAVYEEEAFDKLNEKLTQYSYLNPKSRSFIRTTLASVRELTVDSHGRITLSKEIVDKYKIDTSVVVIGVSTHFEIWDKKAYEDYQQEAENDFEDNAFSLSERDN